MHFSNLNIENFRGLSAVKIEFDPKLTIIVGRNGAGKTSILDVLASLMPVLNSMWPTSTGGYLSLDRTLGYRPTDVRNDSDELKISVGFRLDDDPAYPSFFEDNDYQFHVEYIRSRRQIISKKFPELTQSVRPRVKDKPLFVYYRQSRGFQGVSRNHAVLDESKLISSSLDKNLHAINDLGLWWDLRDADEARHVRDKDSNYRDPQLEAIRALIKEIDSFDHIFFSSTYEPSGLYFSKNDGTEVHVDSLSSGERSYIILLADLARRLQILHPEKKLSEIPGVVLIDEIELNLHPKWQNEIIQMLQKVFASCQFIITTHSPQILSNVEAKHIRILETKDGMVEVKTPLNTKGRTSGYLLEGVFDADERSPQVEEYIRIFNNAVEQGNPSEAREALAKIRSFTDGEPPEFLLYAKRLKKIEGI